MSLRILTINFILIIICVLLSSCGNSTFEKLSNYTITSIDVRNNKIIMEGKLHSSLIVVEDYGSKIEDGNMYISIYLSNAKSSQRKDKENSISNNSLSDEEIKKHYGIYFEETLSDDINKIFITDGKNEILVWDKVQGYDIFEIENQWKDKLQQLK